MKKGRSHGHFHGKQILYKIRKLILFYKKAVYDNKMHVNFSQLLITLTAAAFSA